MSGWRSWVPDGCAGLVVLLIGMLEVVALNDASPAAAPGLALVLVVIGTAGAVGLSRRLPALSLALVWGVCGMQLATGARFLLVELAIGAVAFGVARRGSTATVWASAASIPTAMIVALVWIDSGTFHQALDTAGFRTLVEQSTRFGDRIRLSVAIAGTAIIGVPWLAGLALRFADRARASRASQVVAEAQRDQAEEVAQLREQQAQLARDVHDVVGHSLTVILVQAESAQYLSDSDVAGLKRTMENIATSARSSLEDVRQVLGATGDGPSRARHTDLDSLVEGVRASGHDVISTEVGSPRPLPPELEVIAFRVLQEMLTNALKHGLRDQPVTIERHWDGDLRIEVTNAVAPLAGRDEETRPLATAGPSMERTPGRAGETGGGRGDGQGIEGMRRRLEAVGGRLDARRRQEPATFTATAWVPVRSR